MSDLKHLKFKVVSYRKGMVMSTDWCTNWMEAEDVAEDRMKHPSLYDEVRIINLEDKKDA